MTQRNDTDNRRLASQMAALLADTYAVYNATQNFHWNVESKNFYSRHNMFEDQYRALAKGVDMLAERIRILGFYTPGTLQDIRSLTAIEQPLGRQEGQEMLHLLVQYHGQILNRANSVLKTAKEQGDEGTTDAIVERIREHEEMLWMLKSHTSEGSERLADLAVAPVDLRQAQ